MHEVGFGQFLAYDGTIKNKRQMIYLRSLQWKHWSLVYTGTHILLSGADYVAECSMQRTAYQSHARRDLLIAFYFMPPVDRAL